ncbi:uncharacterized protein LOC135926860 [Gordionus sp. m RMFG-2023]|uniref:uncharacterized protein LOC135926860 n=1 Tax=Gordionus sp. m RMFG-2023 TaxID=3053472 RepID=UPI0031FD1C35
MLERTILLKLYLTTYTNHLQNTNQENYISDLAWNNIEIYREFLEPFNFATEMASCANTPSISTIIPLYSSIFEHVKSYNNNPNAILKTASLAALTKLNKYYNFNKHLFIISTMIDPRFILSSHLLKHNNMETLIEYLNEYNIYKINNNNSAELTNEAQNNKELSFYDKIYQVKPHNNNNLEISKYIDEATISNDTNPLDWWKLNKNRYPVLSKIARDYLAIPATSSSSERTFLEGLYVITDQRCSLDEHSIQACLCLKC